MFRFVAIFLAFFAVSAFGLLSSRIAVRSSVRLNADDANARDKSGGRCENYKVDKNGRCPGDTGYVSFTKENIPVDFAAFAAEQKAKKAAAAAAKGK